MAIGKWIPFGAAQSVPPNAPAAVPVDDQPRIISAADAKQFGLENVSVSIHLIVAVRAEFVHSSLGIHGTHHLILLDIGERHACKRAGVLCVLGGSILPTSLATVQFMHDIRNFVISRACPFLVGRMLPSGRQATQRDGAADLRMQCTPNDLQLHDDRRCNNRRVRTELTTFAYSYANSVLQALYFCGPFRELLVQYPDPTVPDIATLPSPTATAPSPVISHPTHPPNVRRKTERKYSTSDVPQASSPQLGSSPNPQNGTIPGIFPIPSSPPTLLSALRSLYLHISKNPADKGTIAPRAFIEKLKELNEIFRGTMHQDAHEFLNYLLNRIVEEIEDDRRNFLGTTNGKNVSGEDCEWHSNFP